MDFWPEFIASSWGKEFVAGGFGGIAGVVAGYPLDTLRIRQQSSNSGSAISIFRRIVSTEGPSALYRGMGAPLASVTFQVALGGVGTGALQSLILSPVELLKIRLQLKQTPHLGSTTEKGPTTLAKTILKTEGLRGLYRGLTITVLRDAPAHGLYFWTYEYVREMLHPGCRKTGQETLTTMLVAGGLAGVASWVSCYPLDVIKTRLQAQTRSSMKYSGILDCFRKSVEKDGYGVLWRGLGTAVARAFVVNGAIFAAYELSLRCLFGGVSNESIQADSTLKASGS
ncbi:Mitochondrial arginine transporter BAC2 [Bienertia sinuspersici]